MTTPAGLESAVLNAGVGADDVHYTSTVANSGELQITVYAAKDRAPLTTAEVATLQTYLRTDERQPIGTLHTVATNARNRTWSVVATVTYHSSQTDVTTLQTSVEAAHDAFAESKARLNLPIIDRAARSALFVEGVVDVTVHTISPGTTTAADRDIWVSDSSTDLTLTLTDLD